MYDVAIIGAGAIGLRAAKLLEGHKVIVIDKARKIGGHTCSGLYSTNLGKFIDIKEEWVENRIKKAVLHSPGGIELVLEKPGTAAYVINRDAMEGWMAGQVKSEIMLDAEVVDFTVGEHVTLKTTRGTVESKLLIASDGGDSLVARRLDSRPAELLSGLIALTDEECHDGHVDLWFDKAAAGDGFLWKIPRGERTEYGIMATAAKFSSLEKFFGLKGYEKRFGFITVGPSRKTSFNRILLMGNAAGIVKPWSGGGIIYGMQCAGMAASVASEALKKNRFGEDLLGRFEAGWREAIGKNIELGMMFREFYKSASNKDVDSFFSMLKAGSLDSLDMDFPMLDLG
ncbi:MAG: NAD(P)-binding protein [Candidatus Aenigmarchaeota archaeon]|nr:NAD(P)-binding protein [Candidatus Aenigmarchaeota archaeon]